MPTLPTSLVLALSTVAATACVAEAGPDRATHEARPRAAAPRPLVRATPAPGIPVARPMLSASERPVCGNIASKGPKRRECKDAVGTTVVQEADAGRWAFLSRTCSTGDVTVMIEADREALVMTATATATPHAVRVAAGAPSPEPLLAACRRGLP